MRTCEAPTSWAAESQSRLARTQLAPSPPARSTSTGPPPLRDAYRSYNEYVNGYHSSNPSIIGYHSSNQSVNVINRCIMQARKSSALCCETKSASLHVRVLAGSLKGVTDCLATVI
eukprot:25217-Prorocentrum_minimum.AAC.1